MKKKPLEACLNTSPNVTIFPLRVSLPLGLCVDKLSLPTLDCRVKFLNLPHNFPEKKNPLPRASATYATVFFNSFLFENRFFEKFRFLSV